MMNLTLVGAGESQALINHWLLEEDMGMGWFPVFKSIGFYRVDSETGRAIMPRLNTTKEERKWLRNG